MLTGIERTRQTTALAIRQTTPVFRAHSWNTTIVLCIMGQQQLAWMGCWQSTVEAFLMDDDWFTFNSINRKFETRSESITVGRALQNDLRAYGYYTLLEDGHFSIFRRRVSPGNCQSIFPRSINRVAVGNLLTLALTPPEFRIDEIRLSYRPRFCSSFRSRSRRRPVNIGRLHA